MISVVNYEPVTPDLSENGCMITYLTKLRVSGVAHRFKDGAGAGEKAQEAAAGRRAGQAVVYERADTFVAQVKHFLQHVRQVDARHRKGILPVRPRSLYLVQQPPEQARLLLRTSRSFELH